MPKFQYLDTYYLKECRITLKATDTILEICKAMKPEEIKKLVIDEDLTLDQLIDVVIEMNGIVGVGLITLGDGLRQYCCDKIQHIPFSD